MKSKLTDSFRNLYSLIKPYRKKLIDPLLKIIGLIILCAILVRVISGHETLSDYAAANPETAYGTYEQENK